MSNPDPLATVTPFIRIRFHEFGHGRGESYYQGSLKTSKTAMECVACTSSATRLFSWTVIYFPCKYKCISLF